uniref:Uncharacterized protein n=1 Tax=Glossina brevipalpis TaxID=37001 RepID=A0A1A9W170_9MUSC
MDIFQRTCCKGYKEPEKDEEIEIFESESAPFTEEEEQTVEEEEKQVNMNALYQELECMKRRIQMMQLRIKSMMIDDECPEEECVDLGVLLTCSENKEICELQKNHHKLQCQINELIRCCKEAKEHIKDLRLRMCAKAREILQLQKVTATLLTWRNTLEYEFGKCIERFEYLKHVKAEWEDVDAKFEKQKVCYTELEETFVPKACFLQEKKVFMSSINDIKEELKKLYDSQILRFEVLEKLVLMNE